MQQKFHRFNSINQSYEKIVYLRIVKYTSMVYKQSYETNTY